MEKIDSHCHFWNLLDEKTPHDPKLLNSYPNKQLLDEYENDGWKCQMIHVEALPNDPLLEVDWVLQNIKSDKLVGIVAYCDLSDSDSTAVLSGLKKREKTVGIRQIMNFSEDESFRSWPKVAKEYVFDDVWKRNFITLNELNLAFDLQCNPKQLNDFFDFFKNVPNLTNIIVDHLAVPQLDGKDDTKTYNQWKEGLYLLSKIPNIFVKISAPPLMFKSHCAWWREKEGSEEWKLAKRMRQEVIDMFGSTRCMWGSNSPVDMSDNLSPSESQALVEEMVESMSVNDKKDIYFSSAKKAYCIV